MTNKDHPFTIWWEGFYLPPDEPDDKVITQADREEATTTYFNELVTAIGAWNRAIQSAALLTTNEKDAQTIEKLLSFTLKFRESGN